MNSVPVVPQHHLAIISHSGLHEPWREIAHMGTHLVLPRSHYNYQAPSDCFYFLEKGRVRLTYTNMEGEDHVVMFFGKGCLFNETSVLIQGSSTNMASFRVLERSEVYRFPGSLLSDTNFIVTYPHLYRNMLEGTALKFSNLFTLTYLTKHGTPLARLCRFLRQVARAHNNNTRFPLEMTQIELASVLDIHRVSLFRCLHQLREKGILLSFSRHDVEVSDLERLDAVLHEQEETDWG